MDQELQPEPQIIRSLNALGYAETISHSSEEGKLKVRFRVHSAKDWLPVMSLLLDEEQRAAGRWQMHLCKQYMRGPAGVGYIWNLVVQVTGDTLQAAENDLCRMLDLISSKAVSPTLQAKPKPRARQSKEPGRREGVMVNGRIVEYPLVAPANRNKPEVSLFAPSGKRKGVHFIGGGD